jgi:hypothetical protein
MLCGGRLEPGAQALKVFVGEDLKRARGAEVDE